jgi:DNA-binding NarL/FixJ family response regulator
MLSLGVRGFVPKSARLSELRQAVDAVAAGDTWFSESFQKAMADALIAPESDVDAKGSTLTEREKEIAVLLAKSNSSKEVAQKLDISAKTVENHRTNLMRKLGVHDVAGVIRYVIRQGLFDPTEA